MNTISKYMVDQNEKFHKIKPDYGANGHKWKKGVVELYKRTESSSILDYGAGKQTLSKSLSIEVQNYDPGIKEISNLPSPADLLVCTHILEHIEPDLLDNVLKHIKELTNKAFLIAVDSGPSGKILPDGTDSNLIQQSVKDWYSLLKKYFPEFNIINVDRKKFIYQGNLVLDNTFQKGTFIGTKIQ